MSDQKKKTNPISKLPYTQLRKAKAFELKAGGVWYRLEKDGSFSTVVNDLDNMPISREDFRKEIKKLSNLGKIYLRKDKPNFPLTQSMESWTKQMLQRYEKRK